jgi:thiamine kinase-like enzyme
VYYARQQGKTPTFTIRLQVPSREWRLRREADLLADIHFGCPCVPQWSGAFEDLYWSGDTLLVHDYAPGAPAPLDAVSGSALTALAACLAKIHANHRSHYAIWPWLRQTSGTRAEAFRDRVAALDRFESFEMGISDELRERVDRAYVELKSIGLSSDDGWSEREFAQLHGDLSMGNIIWNGDSVTLIDWEYARDGDPAEDLAYLFAEQPASEDVIAAFYRSYVAAGGDPHAVKRAVWYTPLVALDSALWWGDYHLEHGNDPSVAAEVLGFIELAEALLRKLGDAEF